MMWIRVTVTYMFPLYTLRCSFVKYYTRQRNVQTHLPGRISRFQYHIYTVTTYTNAIEKKHLIVNAKATS